MAEDVLEILERAGEGLLYPSESDAPFEAFVWEGAGGRSARDEVAARAGKGAMIEEMSVEAFFSELEESEDAEGFARLRRVLEETLEELRVLRAGKVKVDVYLVGRTCTGAWAGLHTTSVET